MGIAILSTSRGVLDGRSARQLGIGGEWICSIW
jgi:small subunit ribosomal protein S8